MFKNVKAHVFAVFVAGAVLSLVAATEKPNFVSPADAAKPEAREQAPAVSVQVAGSPIAGATVTLYAAGEGAPAQLAQGKTDANGGLQLKAKPAPTDSVLYLVAKGGTPEGRGGQRPQRGHRADGGAGNRSRRRRSWSTNSPPWPRRSPPRGSSTGKRSPGIRSDCGSPPGTFRTWSIP